MFLETLPLPAGLVLFMFVCHSFTILRISFDFLGVLVSKLASSS